MLPVDYQEIIKTDIQKFIVENETIDVQQLRLKEQTIHSVSTSHIAQQIIGRRKAKYKLPTLYAAVQVIYPPSLNIEQSSSEATATYKTKLVQHHLKQRKRAIDLTGGLGIDTFFFSTIFEHIDYVEKNKELLAIVQHNHSRLGATNISYHSTRAEEIISEENDWNFIYVDPMRRNEQTKKLFLLADTQPNVVELQNILLSKAPHILIKTSPLLDIQAALCQVNFVKTVTVLSVDNECKELLLFISKNSDAPPSIEAVNISTTSQQQQYFQFFLADEATAIVSFSDPLEFIYEPNASILKAGAFKSIAQQFALYKLSKSTHLYTSSQLIENFPGRSFKVIKRQPTHADYDTISNRQVNVITRNYPLSPNEIKKKYKLKDGGEQFLIGCSGVNKKFLVLAERIKVRP